MSGPVSVVLDDLVDEGLIIDVYGGSATGWKFGLAWFDQDYDEESCIGDAICHPLEKEGGTLAWCDQNEGVEGCTGVPEIYIREGRVSFMIKPELGLGCWTWGDEASYWPECTARDWDPSSY